MTDAKQLNAEFDKAHDAEWVALQHLAAAVTAVNAALADMDAGRVDDERVAVDPAHEKLSDAKHAFLDAYFAMADAIEKLDAVEALAAGKRLDS
jgi:hypothetical protein